MLDSTPLAHTKMGVEILLAMLPGNPAIIGISRRPVALRPCLSARLPFNARRIGRKGLRNKKRGNENDRFTEKLCQKIRLSLCLS